MATPKVITGALAIIKVDNTVIGKMRDVRAQESMRRQRVPKGLGSIFADEFAVVEWAGTLNCSFWEINYKAAQEGKGGIKGGINRLFGPNILSQLSQGGGPNLNFEDNLVLDYQGVDVDIFKKAVDVIDQTTGEITPKADPYATIKGCFIESDNINIADGQVGGRDQTFNYLLPVTQPR